MIYFRKTSNVLLRSSLFVLLLASSSCDSGLEDKRDDNITCEVPTEDIRSMAFEFPYTQGEKQPDLINPPLIDALVSDFFIDPSTRVVGFFQDGIPIAIPLATMHYHLIANLDSNTGGHDLTVSYSRFTESVRVYRRGDTHFRNADEIWGPSNVFFDQVAENSLWSHFLGKAICGPKTGEYIESHPSYVMSYQEWEALNPSTNVYLQADFLPYSLGYEQILQVERATYPNDDDDQVIAFISQGDEYRLDLSSNITGMHILNTINFGNRRVVVFAVPQANIANAFYSDLEFEINDFNFTDSATGSTWDLMGRATSGPELGKSLEPVPEAFLTNKGSWNSFFPSNSLP